MKKTLFEIRLNELLSEFTKSPAGIDFVAGSVKPGRRKTDKHKEETLSQKLEYLGFNIKYTLFDLEATRRENRYLRKILEQKE